MTINYIYDELNLLEEANYSDERFYHYTYDSVGNRLSASDQYSVSSYQYDDANRMTGLNGISHTWDNNGNLLDDGVNTYTYDPANRLSTVNGPPSTVTYAYNGLGDRLQTTVGEVTTTFAMDYNTGLTQVLDDGTNTYLYGNGRIAQVNTTAQYFLGDALGSVRQVTNPDGNIVLAKAYDPYGVNNLSSGTAESNYGFTGEYTEPTGDIYLRARHYSPYLNQFLQRDTIVPDPRTPADWNRWTYARNNPINYTEPSGYIAQGEAYAANQIVRELRADQVYIQVDWGGSPALLSGIPVDPMIIPSNCAWNPGLWTLNELYSVKHAVHIMKTGISQLGGSFHSLILSATLKRVISTSAKAEAFENRSIEFYTLWHDVPNNWDKTKTVIHEFAHIVNVNNPLSLTYFMQRVGSMCLNPGEKLGIEYCASGIGGSRTVGFYISCPSSAFPCTTATVVSPYAMVGNWEDYAETFAAIVLEGYKQSGANDGDDIYNFYNHNNIDSRRTAMSEIITGWWKRYPK